MFSFAGNGWGNQATDVDYDHDHGDQLQNDDQCADHRRDPIMASVVEGGRRSLTPTRSKISRGRTQWLRFEAAVENVAPGEMAIFSRKIVFER